jgi:hypothetical protein
VENPHPFIFFKILIMLEEWKEELNLEKTEYDKFLDTLYSEGKYEL